jgi:hypothetical protein
MSVGYTDEIQVLVAGRQRERLEEDIRICRLLDRKVIFDIPVEKLQWDKEPLQQLWVPRDRPIANKSGNMVIMDSGIQPTNQGNELAINNSSSKIQESFVQSTSVQRPRQW